MTDLLRNGTEQAHTRVMLRFSSFVLSDYLLLLVVDHELVALKLRFTRIGLSRTRAC
jgi:hypothetical protein